MSVFTHPLARDAKVWQSAGVSGQPQNILVIITRLELDKTHRRYNAKHVERLSEAARDWLRDNSLQASDFLLMNRPKRWAGDND